MYQEIEKLLSAVTPLDKLSMYDAQARWDAIAKPLHGLGYLEDFVVKIAGIQEDSQVNIQKKCVAVMCADNGVVAQGVTQTSQDVTAIVAENMTKNVTSVCKMAGIAGCCVIPVNIGCATLVHGEGMVQASIRPGTGDITKEPAMTENETIQAILVGIEQVKRLKDQGFHLIATGEMGIGNTTTSTAVLSVLLGENPRDLVGVGAGLSPEGLVRKKEAIQRAISLHRPDPNNVIEVLAKVGGLDLAGLCGVFLGGAIYRVPILVDGLISAVSALCAHKMCDNAVDFMIPSHNSKEKSGMLALSALGLTPIIHGAFALGEGTGAVAMMPLLDMAVAVYENMSNFEEIGVAAYTPHC